MKTMINPTVFGFEGKQVRFVGSADRSEWIASNVCAILQLNISEAVNESKNRLGSGLDEDQNSIFNVNPLGPE